MTEARYDLVVLGAGSGGLATSKRAASYGARVAIIEQGRVGGTCVIRGCVPKKFMVYAADFAHAFEDSRGYGWSSGDARLDWAALVAARDANVRGLEETHERLLRQAGVDLLRGHARISGPNEVTIDGVTVTAGRILVATGSRPSLPSIDGIEHVITSDGFFELDHQPRDVALIGGGYIACELGGVFQAVGTKVHLVYRGELPLRGFDGDLRRELDSAMRSSGMFVHARTHVRRIAKTPSGTFVLDLVGPDGDCTLSVERCMLYATGRRANTEELGLEQVGVALDELGNIVCGEDASTAAATIFAIGDVTGRSPLTPVAIHAGRLWADRIYGGRSVPMTYENIPSAVFSDPPIGTVGLSEEEARVRYGDEAIQVFKAKFRPMLHNLTGRDAKTTVKLVVRRDDERVLGCHLIGRDAPEIIQGFAVAVKMGATKRDFDATVGIHPTTAEELVTLR
ncbi:MAG TPA: glutathione-disulfide reductase [Candidatus Binatia bacterium]